jgi:hypothetical protein
VQVKVVLPTGKRDPDAGEQLVVTGGAPPTTVGGGKFTTTGLPSADEPVATGQVIDGPSVVDGATGAGVWPDTSADG